VITDAGHRCLFLPKFHPELNPIEMYWGWAKRYFRERTTGNFKVALGLITEALDACPIAIIRRFFRRTYRYMSVYELGISGLLAEFAVKKYKSHRGITKQELVTAADLKKISDAREAESLRRKAAR
jgi:transposase